MEKRGHKESISFNSGQRGMRNATNDALVVTDEEVELALRNLQMIVAGESVPSIWQDEVADGWNGEGAGVQSHREDGITEPISQMELSIASMDSAARLSREPSHHVETSRSKSSRRRTWRKAAFGGVAAVVLVGLLASPLGSKAMAAAMQTLYFHNIVGVGQNDLNQIQQAFYSSGVQNIDLKQYGSVEVSGNQGGQQNVTVDDASKLIGFPVKTLPGFNPKTDNLSYTQSSSVTFRLNVGAINQLFSQLGGKDAFPDSVNQEPITVQVPPQIYESVSGAKSQMFLSIRKMQTIQVPGNVDMNQVRNALMGLPFLPSDIRQSLQTSADWQDTLYLPVGGKLTNMTINGYTAILQSYPGSQQRSIIWLENGVLYQLNGSLQAFPTDASIISLAKELSQ